MRVIEVRNVHEALPIGLDLLKSSGIMRESRNGPVRVAPFPVATVYKRPWERVIFWEDRDANPFFHLYESLWMLAGRNDLEPLTRYVKHFDEYSDDGKTVYDAYGYRWRYAFGRDQLKVIINRLKRDKMDRRCVLQMWGSGKDLGHDGKAVPCNLVATFQRNEQGHLDMVVFNRSNDIIWGTYGANAVHFSVLQEYMAYQIGCSMGTYTHISSNYHAYVEVMNKIKIGNPYIPESPYDTIEPVYPAFFTGPGLDDQLKVILDQEPFEKVNLYPSSLSDWARVALVMLHAHYIWRNKAAPERYNEALKVLSQEDRRIDWIAAGVQWIQRRRAVWQRAMDREVIETAKDHETLGEA